MKTSRSILIVMLAITYSVTVFASPGYPTSIKAGLLGWEYDSSNGETVNLLDMYTDDAVLIPPSSEIVTGPYAILAFWNEILRGGISEYEIDTINLHIDGDTAYQTAYWQSSFTSENGKVFHIDGTMTNVLQRQPNGLWKIRTQSWN